MKSEVFWWLVTLVVALSITVGVAAGYVTAGIVLFAGLGFMLVTRLGHTLRTDADPWLPGMLQAAFLAKILGTLARFYMVTVLFGTGDSFGYHRAAEDLVHAWRSFEVPVTIGRSLGTRFTEQVTALLYTPGVPTFLGGFFIFAMLAFAGTIFFYLAARKTLPSGPLKTYAVLLFFMPSLLFWPASIGKDSLMVASLGLAAYGVATVMAGRPSAGVLASLPALGVAAGVRAHVAVLLLAAAVGGIVLARRPGRRRNLGANLVVAAAAVVALFSLASVAANNLGLQQDAEGLQAFLEQTEERTAQGGSAVTGSPVQSPVDLPEAILRVVYRPLPHEITDPSGLLSGLEGLALLLFTAVRTPTMLRNLGRVRRYPYLLFAFIYTGGFIVAFSAIFNLGILARQRVQLIPILLVLLVWLGWRDLGGDEATDERREVEVREMEVVV